MKKFIAGAIVATVLITGVGYASANKVEAVFHPVKYFFSGVEKTPTNGPVGIVHNNTIYVPIRFVAENLDKDVRWDQNTQSVYIEDKSNAVVPTMNDRVTYKDGTYRGMFADRGEIQVAVEFKIENNMVKNISFRQLAYSGVDYRTEKEDQKIIGLRKQHEQLINYLIGKDVRVALEELYEPGNIVSDKVDTMTGATLRSGKIISAMRDALNRGVYKY